MFDTDAELSSAEPSSAETMSPDVEESLEDASAGCGVVALGLFEGESSGGDIWSFSRVGVVVEVSRSVDSAELTSGTGPSDEFDGISNRVVVSTR